MDRDTGYQRLEQLYARIPSMRCQGRCADSCTSIDLSDLERERIAERGFMIPPRRSVRAIKEEGQATGRVTACPALNALGVCRVYDVRPLICRAFGASEGLSCAYGCEPVGRAMTFQEFATLLADVEDVSRAVTGGSTHAPIMRDRIWRAPHD